MEQLEKEDYVVRLLLMLKESVFNDKEKDYAGYQLKQIEMLRGHVHYACMTSLFGYDTADRLRGMLDTLKPYAEDGLVTTKLFCEVVKNEFGIYV